MGGDQIHFGTVSQFGGGGGGGRGRGVTNESGHVVSDKIFLGMLCTIPNRVTGNHER